MSRHEADWVNDGAYGQEKARALHEADYDDPRDYLPGPSDWREYVDEADLARSS